MHEVCTIAALLLKGPSSIGATTCPSPSKKYNPVGSHWVYCCCGNGCCWDSCNWSSPPQDCLKGVPNTQWVWNDEIERFQAVRTLSDVPKIITKTSDETFAGTKSPVYFEVCDTQDGNNCCKQLLDNPNTDDLEDGAADEFPFSDQFIECWLTSKRLSYFMSIDGNDDWKVDEIRIRIDPTSEIVCTLDGWLSLDGSNQGTPRKPLHQCSGQM